MSNVDYYARPVRQSRAPWVIAAIVIGVAFAAYQFASWRWSRAGRDAVPRAVTPRGDLADDEKSIIAVFRSASPSVVHITTLAVRQNAFNFNVMQIPQGTGSGFVWDELGHVVTNFHVIQDADAATVTMTDHSNWKASLVGAYPDKDLAVLRVAAPKDRLHPLLIGASADLQVGQKVFAIGNPFGLDQSLTTGIISALGREISSVTEKPIKDVIQTDAAINPGNSGGPLLDSAGRLIGVNTAIFSPSGTFAGIGFAIPVDEVNRIVPQLIRHGRVIRPGLGIQIAPDRWSQEFGFRGVLILSVVPDGPAAKAGLRGTSRDSSNLIQLGDIITAMDKTRIQSTRDLFEALSRYELGSKVTLTLLRDGKQFETTVVLEAI